MPVYTVKNMRVLLPSPAIAAKNPDRVMTVAGTFTDEDGNTLTAKSKVITREIANREGFALDVKGKTLTIPSLRVGRRTSEGASEDDILAALAAAQNVDSEDESEDTDNSESDEDSDENQPA